jgi:guanylate cyclase
MGDSYMAVAGAPAPVEGHAVCAVAMGLEMFRVVSAHASKHGLPLSLRVGVHSGPAVAGVIGTARLSYDLWGDTVNVASRMESQGIDGAVQVSEVTAGLLDGAFPTEPRGVITVRGRGPMKTFLIRPPADLEPPEHTVGPAAGTLV